MVALFINFTTGDTMSIQYVNDGSEWSGEFVPVLITDLVDLAFCVSNEDFYGEFERIDDLENECEDIDDDLLSNIHKKNQRAVINDKGVAAFGVNLLFQDQERDLFYVNESGEIVLLDVYGGNFCSVMQKETPESAFTAYGPWQFIGKLEDYPEDLQ